MTANLLAVQARVIGALVLRDLRTRFGRTFFGTMIVVAWPLTHLVIITCVFLVSRRITPIGTDTAVFIGTGVLPYILCLYPARMIMLTSLQNKPLLGLPAVKMPDLIIARTIVEVVAAFWVTFIFLLMLYVAGVEVIPHRVEDAILAIISTVLLGLSIGWVGAVMFALARAWIAVQIGLLILMYISSGVFFIPTQLPEKFRNILWYNPLLHAVEWLRSAYYEGYGYGMLSIPYLLSWSVVCILLSLAMERAIRGRLLQQ